MIHTNLSAGHSWGLPFMVGYFLASPFSSPLMTTCQGKSVGERLSGGIPSPDKNGLAK